MKDDPEKVSDTEAAKRRDEALLRMLRTPPQPRTKKEGREPKPAPKRKA